MYEKEQYFYHPDHLGSSSFVTDEKGKVYEHLEYFPFGETFAHEHSNTQNTPYRFTGKEYDEVTGLYYYGARYYDPRTSVWQSPDPILGEYMSGQTNGGVFNPKNLNMFGYTYNNPVNFVDPDGRLTYDPSSKGFTTDKGDTLQGISRQTGVSMRDIYQANDSRNSFKGLDKAGASTPKAFAGGSSITIPENNNIKAFKWAASKIGDTDYAYSTKNGAFGNPSNKCNLFVSDAYKKGTNSISPRHKAFGLIPRSGPATASELAGQGSSDRNSARIGDIASWSVNYSDATGHTTIYTGNVNIKGYNRQGDEWGTIGAGSSSVNYRTSTYLRDNTQGHYLPQNTKFLGVE